MAKIIAFDQEAREAIRRGVSKLARRTPVSVLVTNFNREGLDHQPGGQASVLSGPAKRMASVATRAVSAKDSKPELSTAATASRTGVPGGRK